MSPERDNSKLVWACLYLVVGLLWLFIAVLNFDGLRFLISGFTRFHSRSFHSLAAFVAGLLGIVNAAVRFRSWLHPEPEVKRTALWPRL
jgi:hypothetical protein